MKRLMVLTLVMITGAFCLNAQSASAGDEWQAMIANDAVEVVKFYDNGALLERGFVDGNGKTGIWQRWCEEGKPVAQMSFKNDRKHGACKIWQEGHLKYQIEYKNGRKLSSETFYANEVVTRQ